MKILNLYLGNKFYELLYKRVFYFVSNMVSNAKVRVKYKKIQMELLIQDHNGYLLRLTN